MSQIFKYRIIETTYRHTHPNQDWWDCESNPPKEVVIWEKEKDHTLEPKDFGKRKFFSQGGWISYSFELQLFNKQTNEWELVGFLETE